MYVIDIKPCLRRRLRPNSLIVNNFQYPERRRATDEPMSFPGFSPTRPGRRENPGTRLLTSDYIRRLSKKSLKVFFIYIVNDLPMVYF